MISDITVEVRAQKLNEASYDAIMFGVFKDELLPNEIIEQIDEWGTIKIKDLIDQGEIKGDFKEFTIVHYKNTPFKRVIIMGMGKKEDYSLDVIRSISAKAARTLRRIGIDQMAVLLRGFPNFTQEEVAQVVTEGVILGLYKYEKDMKNGFKLRPFNNLLFLVEKESDEEPVMDAAERGFYIANGSNLARDLANMPANKLTIDKYVERIKEEAKKSGSEVIIYGRKELEEKGFGGILAVGQGSSQEPRLVHVKYRKGGDNAPLYSVVGKGVVFDSGGLNLKTGNYIYHMHYDMAGSASCIGLLYTVTKLNIPINLDVIVPLVENAIGNKSIHPGDVIKTYKGIYVEVANTDAEGRLILADALTYASEQEPDVLMDIATLTGAVKKALGNVATGVMTNSDELYKFAQYASDFTEEKIWRLPLFKEYEIQLKSIVADIRNIGDGGAGSSLAALFLSYFVSPHIPWIHFDIAGTAWIDEISTQYYHKPYLPKKGATGVGSRLFFHIIEYLEKESEKNKAKIKEVLKK